MVKHLLILCLATLLNGAAYSQQWEQIGWRGSHFEQVAQCGRTLFAKAGTGFYKSSDWGKTWQLFRKGLPNNLKYNEYYGLDQLYFYEAGDKVYLGQSNSNPPQSPYLNAVVYTSEKEESWRMRTFTPIDEWTLIHDLRSFHEFSEDSIAILHNAGDYANTFYDTNGVYCSTDGGTSWHKRMLGVPKPQLPRWYYRQLIRQGQRLLLSTGDLHQDALYKSDDFGESWQKVILPFTSTYFGEVVPMNDNVLMTLSDGKRYFSNDGGSSWFEAPKPLPTKEEGRVYYSEFGYRTKTILLSFDSSDKKAGPYQLYRSTDDAASWQRVYPAFDSSLYIENILGTLDTVIVFQSPYAPLFITDSAFASKFILPTDQYSLNNYQLAVYNGERGLHSINGWGDSALIWDENGAYVEYAELSDTIRFSSIEWITVEDTIYALAHHKSNQRRSFLYRSIDAGLSWHQVSPLPTKLETKDMFITQRTIFVSALGGETIFSKDFGETWSPFVAPVFVSKLVGGDSLIVILGEKQHYVSNNLGLIWREITTPVVGTIHFIANNRLFLWAWDPSHSGPNAYSLYYSDDVGESWIQSTLSRSDRHFEVVNFKDNLLFGVSIGFQAENYQLCVSLDTGRTWRHLGDSTIGAGRFFNGKDYYFLAGDHELWRLPKQPLAVKHERPSATPSLAITPNPATDRTSITYSLPHGSTLDLSIYDLLGRKLATLASGISDGDEHTVQWNAEHITPGVYVVRLVTSEGSATRMLQMIR